MSRKKISLILGCLLLAGGTIFPDENVLPKNTVTVDVGQTAFFLLFTGIMNVIALDTTPYAFGNAAQYERQITEKSSTALRFEYGLIDISDADYKWKLSSFSAEGHGRFYPAQGVFFIGGTLGYASIFGDFSTPDRERKSTAHYVKYGGKLGWRIDFDKPGGFVLEPAFGYYGVIGTRLKTGYEEDLPILGGMLNLLYDSIARGLFAGGLRFSLGLGCRF